VRAVPLSVGSALANEVWRSDPIWPEPLKATRGRLRALQVEMSRAGGTAFDGADAVVTLASGSVFSRLGAIVDHLALSRAGHDQGLALEEAPPPTRLRRHPEAPHYSGLRRLARMATLNPPGAWLAALSAPRAMIIAHNDLLRDVSSRGRGGVSFRHSGEILGKARQLGAPLDRDAFGLAGKRLTEIAGRFGVTAQEELQAIDEALQVAAADLAGLSAIPDIAHNLWIATAGAPASRAIAIETRRRGGHVTGFDHGGCSGMFQWNEGLIANEFRIVDQFVTMTEATAEAIREITSVRVTGHDGDPSFRAVARLPSRDRRANPRVLYPLGPFYGFRQWFPPLLPDPVYLAFLDRVASILKNARLDVAAKPRPGGLSPHPIEAVLNARHEPFEAVLPDFDVVIFDDVHSSTFWKTLQTDRGVVLLDLGLNCFTPAVQAMVDARVIRVPVTEDDHNIPSVAADQLTDAIAAAASGHWDGAPFRRLFSDPSGQGGALEL
jgi:hypothetical protein